MPAVLQNQRLVERMPGGWLCSQLTDARVGASQSSLVRCVCEVEGQVRAHYHEAEQITLFQAGEGYMAVGPEIVVIKPGVVVVVPPRVPHGIWNPGPKKIEYLVFLPCTNPEPVNVSPQAMAAMERYLKLFHNAGGIEVRSAALSENLRGDDI